MADSDTAQARPDLAAPYANPGCPACGGERWFFDTDPNDPYLIFCLDCDGAWTSWDEAVAAGKNKH